MQDRSPITVCVSVHMSVNSFARAFVRLPVCHLSFCVSLCPFDFLFVRLSDRLPVVPSIRSAVHPFVCKFLYSCLSLYLPVCLSVFLYPFLAICVWLSACLFVCLSFYMPSLLSVSDRLPACLSVSFFFSLCIHVHLISLTFSFSICSCKDHRPPAAKRLRH